jgi:cation transporter-like permease
MQFAGSHLAASLVAFNIGVELGQIFVLAIAVPVLGYVFRHVVEERMGTIILSAFVAHTAWHWMLDRWQVLRQYDIELPDLNAAFLAGVMRASMLLLIIGGAAWAMTLLYRRLGARTVSS